MVLVTLLVKSFRLPITFSEKVWAPPTTDAAKSEPGSWGMDEARLLPPDDGVEMDGREAVPRPYPGS